MTIPGKLLSKLDPGAIDRLAARLSAGTAALSATNGKTTTAAMAAEILRPRFRLAHNRSGANLVSGVASTLLSAERAELGLFEVDEAALPGAWYRTRRVRPRRARGHASGRACAARPLQRLQRARRCDARPRARRVARRDRRGPLPLQRRLRSLRADSGRRQATAPAPDQE